MDRRRVIVAALLGLLTVITLGGIIVHKATGYAYPASSVTDYELNTLNDLYEIFVLVPWCLAALWLLKRRSEWGIVLTAGAAANILYNYAMFVTGRQNLWVFVWVAKVALSGATLCLVWDLLPTPSRLRCVPRLASAAYLGLVGLAFSDLMGQRLLASARGTMVDMAMVSTGALDWGNPALRDPIVFMTLVLPAIAVAVWGLIRGSREGSRAATLVCTFIVGIVSAILFTGPVRELLELGTVSRPMLGMSVFMTLAALPAVFSLRLLVNPHDGVDLDAVSADLRPVEGCVRIGE